MRPNKLRQLLDEGKPSISTHIHTTWPSVIEAIGHAGLYDYVEFVAEYAPFDLYALDNLARAAELHQLGMMIKVDQEPRSFIAQRAIGSGFQSVLFADCRSAEEVEQCVRLARPDTPAEGGTYGVANRRFSYMGYGGGPDYVEALREIVVMIMIEKGSTVEQLDQVLAVEGVDMIQWGPADYTMSIGKAGQRELERIKEVERHVIEAALRKGIEPRAEISGPEQAGYYLELGVRHFCIGTDLSILFEWWKEKGGALRRMVEDA